MLKSDLPNLLRTGAAGIVVTMMIAFWSPMASADVGINPDFFRSSNQMSIQVGGLSQDYREFNDGLVPSLTNILDSETGTIPYLRVSYRALIRHWYTQVSFGYAYGDTDYVGYLQSPGPVYTPFNTKTTNSIYDFQFRFGYLFQVARPFALVPYAELGQYYWIRDVGPSTPYGITEDYSHAFLGAGIRCLINPAERLVWEIGVGMATNFGSTMETNGYTYDLGDRSNLSAYTSLDYHIAGHWHAKVDLEYRRWEYGQSDVKGGYLEPRSETRQTRFFAGVGYSF